MAKTRAIRACPTPPGPEGSNGKQRNDVPRVLLAYFIAVPALRDVES